ncbi:MAG: nucleotidyltransferase [Erysipelotrichaceae bacterium]|nr:nucleotidyltransferase [Erysipelotrichaceae bacterium]MDY5252668.1 nucleotidyltransferase [Erysipelotrichaceae bacterium]
MKICGIITEYNPLHNGHIHHIKMAKELTNCDVLIAVMSGNFTQRGEMAIVDKHQRAMAAIKHGVDIVLELPYAYATQSANIFAKGAIDILKLAKIDYLCFGSETNNLAELQEIAATNINVNNLKELLKDGNSFPKAYGLLANCMGPNDILGVAYLKQLTNSKIIPVTIQRTTSYHEEKLAKITSAKAIRLALKNNEDISYATPMSIDKQDIVTLEQFYPMIKQRLLTTDPKALANILMFSEGIENHLIKVAKQCHDYPSFIAQATTRRYTSSRINRCLIHMLNNITKQDVLALPPIENIKVLAFNQQGQAYLKSLKKHCKIATTFNQNASAYAQMELKTTYTYTTFLNEKKATQIIKQEISGAIKL